MIDDEDEGSWNKAFVDKFKSRDGVEERIKAERRAGRTPGQRQKKKPPKKQINVRMTDETRDLMNKLADRFDTTVTHVVERAIAKLAEVEGVK